MSEVDEMLDQERPEAWIPEKEGDQIIGKLIRYENTQTDFGRRDIAIVANRDGELKSVWLMGAVLQSQFARLRPKPGDEIGVRYLGKKPSSTKGQEDYKDFRVVCNGGGYVPDFLQGDAAIDDGDLNPFPPDGAAA